ncbi:MAG: molybdate ABC transporter substrate-binding protein, partial [Sphingobium sp.]
MQALLRLVTLCCLLVSSPAALAAPRDDGPLILAAISMQDAMTAAALAWAGQGHAQPRLSFAGSPALARQIRAGGRADLFISADQAWMDDVARGGFIQRSSRANVAANRLVLVSPARAPVTLKITRGMPIARALGTSRLAMADPDSVPAGRYGKAALTHLGVWPSVRNRIARRENVRSALALVERGEARLGIVYATDAHAARRVRMVG